MQDFAQGAFGQQFGAHAVAGMDCRADVGGIFQNTDLECAVVHAGFEGLFLLNAGDAFVRGQIDHDAGSSRFLPKTQYSSNVSMSPWVFSTFSHRLMKSAKCSLGGKTMPMGMRVLSPCGTTTENSG